MSPANSSMSREARKRLLDAAAACAAIAEFTRGKTFDQYEADHLLRSAVERQFEIVGEALGKAAIAKESLAQEIPDLRKIVALRNRIIHGYDSVDDQIMWEIVETKVPALSKVLQVWLEAHAED